MSDVLDSPTSSTADITDAPLTLAPIRNTSFSPPTIPTEIVRYTVHATFRAPFTFGVNEIMRYIYERCNIKSYSKVSIIDGSNIFFLDKKTNDWVEWEEKTRTLRAIPPDHFLVIVMKLDTFLTVRAHVPIERFLSNMQELCIVTVDIPFCSSQLKVDCIRKMKTKKLCSLSQNAGLSRILVTNFKHIYCEYDDIVISKLYRMMHEQPSIVSLDSRVMKTVAQTELFDEFSPMIHVQLIGV